MRSRRRALLALTLALAVGLAACAREPATGPGKVRWDRDVCERCGMSIGDRAHAAQVRLGGERRTHKFDDLGCALLWIDEHAPKGAPRPGIWASDSRGGGWLDAYAARYLAGTRTPMGYGFSAVTPPGDGQDLEAVRDAVREAERERRGAHR